MNKDPHSTVVPCLYLPGQLCSRLHLCLHSGRGGGTEGGAVFVPHPPHQDGQTSEPNTSRENREISVLD